MIKTVIDQDETLTRNLASIQFWNDRTGRIALQKDIAGKLERASAEVSDNIFYGFEMT